MQRIGAQILLSATDLVNFHECGHLTSLDLRALDDKALKAQQTKPDEHTLLFQKGNEFEAAYLADLKREVQILTWPETNGNLAQLFTRLSGFFRQSGGSPD